MLVVQQPEVVITGVGVVTPIGVGRDAFWRSLLAGVSGVRRLARFNAEHLPVQIGAEIVDFDPSAFVSRRKSLKLMSRDAQFGLAAADLACRDAGLRPGLVDPRRFGVVLGADRACLDLDECEPTYRDCLDGGVFHFQRWGEAMYRAFPLLFLKVLPNMIASHVAIAQDAQGPNNTIHQAEISGLVAVCEAIRTIQRGAAEVMIAGGASAQTSPTDWIRHCVTGVLSRNSGQPSQVLCPFDARRDGQVWGEGAAMLILESRPHAEARGAKILARILSSASSSQARPNGRRPHWGGLGQALNLCLERSALRPENLGHVNAHGLSGVAEDQAEAQALAQVLPDVPVFAPKSYFGNLGAAAGAVELAASVLALEAGLVPPTLNYRVPDKLCPLNVVHAAPLVPRSDKAVTVNWTSIGQAVAVLLAGAG